MNKTSNVVGILLVAAILGGCLGVCEMIDQSKVVRFLTCIIGGEIVGAILGAIYLLVRPQDKSRPPG